MLYVVYFFYDSFNLEKYVLVCELFLRYFFWNVIVRFVISSCVCIKQVKFFFWIYECVRFYVIVDFSIGFYWIIDECFVFGKEIDVYILILIYIM